MSSQNNEPPITHLTCSISGHAFTPSSEIVVTPSGYTCEKRLLLSKLTDNGGVDPFDPSRTLALSEKDLVSLKTSGSNAIMPPRPASASSLPSLLNMLQEEYDGLMLELFDTRSALEETRKELSQALYQNDAAVRVIARLTMERDHARQKLTEISSNTDLAAATTTVVEAEPEEAAGAVTKKRKLDDATVPEAQEAEAEAEAEKESSIPTQHVDNMVAIWKKLSKARRKKAPPPPSHATADHFKKGLVQTDKKSLHKSSGKAGINNVLVKGDWVITGANDKAVVVYDRKENKEIANLTGANKEITKVNAIPSKNIVLTGSADGKVRAYKITSPSSAEWTLLGTIPLQKHNNKQSPLVGLEIQPTGKYFLVTSAAGEIAFCAITFDEEDNATGIEHLHSFHAQEGVEYSSTAIHPDGLILGAGSSAGTIELWDLRNQALVSTVNAVSDTESPASAVTALSFSENGYHLLGSNADGQVCVYDIRKIGSDKSIIAKLNVESSDNPQAFVGSTINTVSFDPCGKFLAYGGEQGIVVVAVKEWDTVLTRMDAENGKAISSLAWSEDAKWIASVSGKERITRFWGEKIDDDTMDVDESGK